MKELLATEQRNLKTFMKNSTHQATKHWSKNLPNQGPFTYVFDTTDGRPRSYLSKKLSLTSLKMSERVLHE